MRKSIIWFAAPALALAAPAQVLAQDDTGSGGSAAMRQLSSAGFGEARMLEGVEVARVTDDRGNTFFVLGGLDQAIGGSAGMPAVGGEAGAVNDMVTSGSGGTGSGDPLAGQNLTEQVQSGGTGSASLEEQLAAAGFSEYELLDQAAVAEVVAEGDGQPFHVIVGVEEGAAQ